jgi:hypothetical protein
MAATSVNNDDNIRFFSFIDSLVCYQSVPKMGGGDDSNGLSKEEQKEQERLR